MTQPHGTVHRYAFDVFPNASSMRYVDADRSGQPTFGDPFVISGPVFACGEYGCEVGGFHRAGMMLIPQPDGDYAIVSESLEVYGRGAFYLAGHVPGVVAGKPGFRRALIGGTGEFAGMRAEAVVEMLNDRENRDAFRISFEHVEPAPLPIPPPTLWGDLKMLARSARAWLKRAVGRKS